MDTSAASSKFISQGDIDRAKEARDAQWREAYARLGQEPPPKPQEDNDTRSLAEKLAANKIAKQEEWEERSKLANQFRALEEDEVAFLDSIQEKKDAEDRQRQQVEGLEVKNFREAVAAHQNASKPAPPVQVVPAPSKPKLITTKKDHKKSLKGVVVKKKAKPPAASLDSSKSSESESKKRKTVEDVATTEPDAKRKKGGES
ncbi:N-terminal domain of NEFA-interacting nuclear protein NIP30-domain-containing protein [Flagelloscypha sp. PMI_526]|nr:N-terminal domain of NEFA-interacting nuclear protein NIP30-domain-containing protein [Flagelloscypha sp. PMI_526]